MKRATILATAISLFGSLGANAEPLRAMAAPGGAMPAFEAVTIARSMGLDPLGGPVWRNGRYVLLATEPGGREMRVVLDAYDGSVLAVRPLARRYFEPAEPDDDAGEYVVREEYDTVAPVVPPLPPGTHAVPPQRRAALTPPGIAPEKPVQKKPAANPKPAQAAKAVVPSPPAKPDTTMKSEPRVDKSAKPAVARQAQTSGSTAGEHKQIRKIELYKTPDDKAAGDANPAEPKPEQSKSAEEKPADNGAPTTPVNPLL